MQLTRGVHVVVLSAPRRVAAFRLDALVIVSDDVEARAFLGLPDITERLRCPSSFLLRLTPGGGNCRPS